jgi:hypothetical protein
VLVDRQPPRKAPVAPRLSVPAMLIRLKDPERVRTDALVIAVKKFGEGCPGCAEGYLELARKNGATEAELSAARQEGDRVAAMPRPPATVTRRQLLKGGTAGAMTAASVARTMVWPTRADASASSPVDGSQVAWSLDLDPSNGGTHHLLGVDSRGRLVGAIAPGTHLVLRHQSRLITVASRKRDLSVAAAVTSYDATDGSVISEVIGREIPIAPPPPAPFVAARSFDLLSPALTRDGRYLGLFHQTLGPPVGPALEKEGHLILQTGPFSAAVEVIDLYQGVTAAFLGWPPSPGMAGGGQLIFSKDGRKLFAFTYERSGANSITRLSFDGTSLDIENAAQDDGSGSVVPDGGLPLAFPYAFSGEELLARVIRGGRVQVIDLRTLALRHEVAVSAGDVGAKGFAPLALFPREASHVVVVNVATGLLRQVDLGTGVIDASTDLPVPGLEGGLAELWGELGTQAATVSADGTRVFVADNRGPGGGIWVVSVPGLNVMDHWGSGQHFTALWSSPDGEVLYGANSLTGELHMLRQSDGGPLARATIGNALIRLVEQER